MSQLAVGEPGHAAGARGGARAPQAPPCVGRIPSLDGLRAVAILLVLLAHSTTTHGFPDQALLRRPFGVFGELGVDIFFVLSGFLITLSVLREIDLFGGFSLKNFWTRRALRIGPVFLCLVVVRGRSTGSRRTCCSP